MRLALEGFRRGLAGLNMGRARSMPRAAPVAEICQRLSFIPQWDGPIVVESGLNPNMLYLAGAPAPNMALQDHLVCQRRKANTSTTSKLSSLLSSTHE